MDNPVKKTGINKARPYLISLALILMAAFFYSPVINNDFLNFDDNSYVTENAHVNSGLNSENIYYAFKFTGVSYWHPVALLSHMLDCQLFGLSPGYHHLMSLYIHIINVVLLFILLNIMTGATWRSAFVAALFALHPVNVDSVAWVAERKNLLAATFWLLSMLAYVRYSKNKSWTAYAFILLSMALGLMSKPTVIMLPIVLLLLDYWPLDRLRKSDGPGIRIGNLWPLVYEKIPLFVLSFASLLISLLSLKDFGVNHN